MKRLFALLLAVITLASLCLTACEDAIDVSSAGESSLGESSIEESALESSGKEESSEPEVPPIEPAYCTVISTGAAYTVSKEADSAYADSYGKELTDGQFGPATEAGYGDEKFSGYATGGGVLAISLDLGEVYETIYRFEVSYLNVNEAGIAAPSTLHVYISEDGENWERLSKMTKPSGAELGTTQVAVYESKAYVPVRYVQFRVSPGSAWVFLDEVQVCADVEGEDMDEEYLALLKDRYEADTTTAIERQNLLASVRGNAIDRSLYCNLISANRSYKTSVGALSDYKDSGTMLTDGVESHYFEGGTWVGFAADKDVSVTIDLRAVRSDLAEFSASVFTNPKVGVLAPVLLTLEVSEDNKTFTEIGRVYGPSDTTQQHVEYRLCLDTAVKGRYVRFTFASSGGSHFLVEECGIYAYGEKEKGLILYPEVVLDASDNSYWDASESDYDVEKNLLAGLYPQIMSCDSVTADMINNNTPVTSKLLTDGVYTDKGQTNIHNGMFFKFSNGGSRDVIFDLGHLSEVRGAKLSFLNYTEWAVRLPDYIVIYLSEDGDNWYEVKEFNTAVDTDYCTVPFEVTFEKPYVARFMAVSFAVKAWSASDEMELIGTKKVSGNAVKLADSGLKSVRLVPNGYQDEDENLLNGAGDIVLMYHGQGYNNTVESTLPYVAYLDENGNIKDTMFDGFLYLLTGKMPSGNAGHERTTMGDWTWYLNDLFTKGENLDALNTVAAQVNDALGLNKKYNFYVAMYIPNCKQTNFGDVDGDGTSEDFSKLEDSLKAIDWYMTEFFNRYNEAGYDNLQFGGFYWYSEAVSTYDDPNMYTLVRGVADRVHARGEQFFWIPYFTAAGYSRWASFGFDVACYQPNYAFNGSVLENRLPEAAAMMRRFGMCTEMEIDDAALHNDVFYQKYMGYLRYGITEGYMEDALHMYYQGTNVFGAAARSADAKVRLIYDYTYQFIKETLKYAPDTRETMSFDASADAPLVATLAPEGEINIRYRVSVSPQHGTVTINADGTFVYYPDEGFTGTDTFSYAISANLGYSAPCEVTVNVG